MHGESASEESESSMISKLEDVCGFQYASKLRRMMADVNLSKDLSKQFKERIGQSENDMYSNIDFNIMVLDTNFWPLSPPSSGYVIPGEMLPIYRHFIQYYQNKHSGRKLNWLWNHSKNELRTNYLRRRHILTVSSHQMAILLQYNTKDILSLEELAVSTGITKDLLPQILSVLVRTGLLINNDQEYYGLNINFKPKKVSTSG